MSSLFKLYNYVENIYALFGLILLNSCHRNLECKPFHTGEFRYLKSELSDVVQRNDSIQIEFSPKQESAIFTNIIWVNDCSYELVYTDVMNMKNVDLDEVLGKSIQAEIVQIDGKTFKVEVKGVYKQECIWFEKTSNNTDLLSK